MKLSKQLIMKDKYLLYVRKSTESEDRQVASIESQLEILYQMAQEKGLNVVATFQESKSAKKPGRAEFNKLMATIDGRDDIKGILCWKLNRLSRNPQDSGFLRQYLYDGRITEIITHSRVYTEADSDFLMAIEDAQSQKFIRDLREDTKRGIDKKLEMGHAPILAPVGYKNDLEKRQGERTISPHPMYFKLVRKIFELALTGKFSTYELYKKARQMGIKNSLGRPICRTQMFHILRNPFYTGRFEYGGMMYQGSHIPMITDGEFKAIQNLLKTKSKPRKQTHDFSFTGLLKCGKCGYGCTGESHVKKSGLVFSYYKCSRKGKGCSGPMISAKELDRQVANFLNKIAIKQSYVDWLTKWLREAEKQDRAVRLKQHEVLKGEYTATTRKIDNLTDRWLSVANEDKGLLTDNEYKRLRQKYLIDKQDIYRRMKSSDSELSEWTDTLVATFSFTVGIRDKWNTGDIEDKKNILLVIGSNLVLKDRQLMVEPRTPFRYIQSAVSNQLNEARAGTNGFNYSLLGG